MSASPQEEVAIERYVESPSWRFPSKKTRDATLPKISATFMFAKRLPGHVRLDALNDKLQRESAVCEALVEPTQSYFSDIVRGGLGRMGRPLIFLCEAERELDERTVVMHRPETTDYKAERRHIRLWRPDAKRAKIRWAMRDAFALFESGHLFYLLSLVSMDDQLDRIDEYALIQLQKLLDPSYEATDLREHLKFSFSLSPPDPLAILVRARLHELDKRTWKEPNGVHVLRKHAFEESWELPSFGWDELRSLVFAVEDDQIWRDFATKKRKLSRDSKDKKSWQEKHSRVSSRSPPRHLSRACVCPRLYALSGLLRGVLDFPLQSTSELEDAVEPLCFREDDWVVFSNRQCLVEIGTSKWRSLRDARTSLGTCPYLVLVQCMALYHELLLSDLEKEVDDLLYQAENGRDPKKEVHAKAMVDVSTMLGYARKVFWPPSSRVVEHNLRQRITIFRDLLIFRPINIFSYKMEKDLSDALVAYHKLDARTAAIIDLLDRYEGLVEDNHHVLTMAAERRLSLLFAVVALMGVLTIYEPVEAVLGFEGYDDARDFQMAIVSLVSIVAAFLLLYLLYGLWWRKQ